MKKLMNRVLVTLLGAAVVVFVQVVPFAACVHAVGKSPADIAEVAQELHPDRDQHHDDSNAAGQFSPEAVQQRIQKFHDWQNQPTSIQPSPVDAVKASAASLGLNASTDVFYLMSKTASIAIVHVVHQKKGYNVTLIPAANGAWIAASITPVP